MRILYASERPPYPFFLGGAARCAHRLLLSLAQDHGAQVMAMGSAGYRTSSWLVPPAEDHAVLGVHGVGGSAQAPELDCGYPVQVLPRFAEGGLADALRRCAPDVVWSQLEGAQQVLAVARQHGVATLLYIHDAEDPPEQLRSAAVLADHLVCSSAFLAGKVQRVLGRRAHVIHPASDWYFGTAGDPTGAVTMINPHPVKGVDTFLEIARRLPQQRFLLVESWRLDDAAWARLQQRLATLPNVTLSRRVADMRGIYAQTRLLLVPSVWEEGFGMVAVEAQSCGIPVIASARGGLPEAVGSGGVLVDDHLNVDRWLAAIGAMLLDDASWRAASQRALARAKSAELSPRELASRMLAICEGRLREPPTSWRDLLAARLGRWPRLQRLAVRVQAER